MPVLAPPLNERTTEELLARKDELAAAALRLARDAGIEPGYAYDMMLALRAEGRRDTALLECLLELEAVKYTLCARRLREEGGE
jgi:hypothetical protein